MTLFSKFQWDEIDREIIKRRSNILVIDDDEFPYLTLFKKDEYKIEKWSDIKNLNKLENCYYDVILLDIQGVGGEHSKEEGLGILKHIKEVSPSQIVIAYSNADWSLKYQAFFDLADEKLSKGLDYTEFKRAVDYQLKRCFSYEYYEKKILEVIGNGNGQKQLINSIKKSIKRNDTRMFEIYLERLRLDSKKIVMVLEILSHAISIYKVINGM